MLGDFGKTIRLRRILPIGRRSLVVAFDHALVHGPIPGTENPAAQIEGFIEGGADAILLNQGLVPYFAQIARDRNLPGLILRLDWTTALGTPTIGSQQYQTGVVAAPEDALRNGVDAVITFLIMGTGDAAFEKAEIERVGGLARECERIGMPLIVESLARGPQVTEPRDPKWLMLHTRVAAELGADLIKAEYSGDPHSMRSVVEACPVPILVLGGGRTNSDSEVLQIVDGIVASGAAGVFFGRNIFQAENMGAFMRSMRKRLHVSTEVKA